MYAKRARQPKPRPAILEASPPALRVSDLIRSDPASRSPPAILEADPRPRCKLRPKKRIFVIKRENFMQNKEKA
jgi:hypothetical protein